MGQSILLRIHLTSVIIVLFFRHTVSDSFKKDFNSFTTSQWYTSASHVTAMSNRNVESLTDTRQTAIPQRDCQTGQTLRELG